MPVEARAGAWGRLCREGLCACGVGRFSAHVSVERRFFAERGSFLQVLWSCDPKRAGTARCQVAGAVLQEHFVRHVRGRAVLGMWDRCLRTAPIPHATLALFGCPAS